MDLEDSLESCITIIVDGGICVHDRDFMLSAFDEEDRSSGHKHHQRPNITLECQRRGLTG